MNTTNEQITIEAGADESLDRIWPMWEALREDHATRFPTWADELRALTFEKRKAGLRQKAGRGLMVLIAMLGEQAVGYCIARIDTGGEGEIESLYVKPDRRGRGVGGDMLERSMQWLARHKAHPIVIEVIEGNAAAERLYQKLGFVKRMVRFEYRPTSDRAD